MPLPPKFDDRFDSVLAENARNQEWFDNRISARGAFPIIVNGDFGDLGASNLPAGWTLVGTPTITSVTTPGVGNGISMTGAVGAGIQYAFNVAPCKRYVVVCDVKGIGQVSVGRTGQTYTELENRTFSNEDLWSHSPSIGTLAKITFEAASTDGTLAIRLLTNSATVAAQFADVQIYEGTMQRPFSDFRQGLEGWFKKFTANSFLYAGASGVLSSTAAATNGQILIGSTGAVPVLAAITGTANQVIVTNAAGSITLSTPQNIHTAAAVTFYSLVLSSIVANGTMYTDAGKALASVSMSNGQVLIGSTASTPVAATLTGTANRLSVTNGAGSITLNVDTTLLPSPVAGDANKALVATGANAAGWSLVSLTAGVTGVLPIANGGTNSTATPTNGGAAYGTGTAFAFTAAGTSGQVLTSNGAAAPTWQAAAGGMSIGGTVTGGTTGSVLFIGAGPVLSQNNANFFWDNTSIRLGIGTASPSVAIHVIGSANDLVGEYLRNTSTGTLAYAAKSIQNSATVTDGLWLMCLGSAYTTSGMFLQDSAQVLAHSGLSGGLGIGTAASAPIMFYVGGTAASNETMRINTLGNVGIGTTTPGTSEIVSCNRNTNGEVAVVATNTNAGASAYATFVLRNGTVNTDALYFFCLGTGYTSSGVFLQDSAQMIAHTGLSGGLGIGTGAVAPLFFYTGGTGAANERMRIDSAGNVGIGMTNPTKLLELSADSAQKPTSNTWTITSDVRTKKNISAFTDGLSVIQKFNPIWYEHNGCAGCHPDGKSHVGVSAQDVQVFAPYMINMSFRKMNAGDTMVTEILNFDAHALPFILINAVKELAGRLTKVEKAATIP